MEQSTHVNSRATDRSDGITFAVAEVERATQMRPMFPYVEALIAALGREGGALEGYSRETRPLIDPQFYGQPVHAFIHAANLAYDQHYPLILSPDMIWLLIAQGFAQHVNLNAEALRYRFVAHEGKITLKVVRDEFVRGFAGNDWEGAISEFSAQIREHVGATAHDRVVRRFSTTGIVAQAAFEMTLMDAMQSYFDYRLITRCGIPEITLEGTPEDWDAVYAGAAALADYDLGWWSDCLLPVLSHFARASRGDIDQSFWRSLYKLEHQSGGSVITGHLVNLFPYLVPQQESKATIRDQIAQYERQGRPAEAERYRTMLAQTGQAASTPYRNPYLGWKEPISESGQAYRRAEGLLSHHLPSALSLAPFIWDYLGTKIPMEFVAGFVGVAQDTETLALRPEIGWVVREASPVPG